MTKHISLFSATLLFLALTLGSCNNQIDGCTDPLATNYDPAATNDDGSCQYSSTTTTNDEAAIVFWIGQASSNAYINNDGITAFNFIIDGVSAGTHSLSIVDASAPACDAANHVTVKKTVPQGTLQYKPYVMTSQTGDTIITGQFPFLGGSCSPIELTY